MKDRPLMDKLHILTVQDFIWLNQELTGQRHKFSYATLEEAVYYQYSYGTSTQLHNQAARLLTGFAKLCPFEAGSQATAFAGMTAFLKINGVELTVQPEEAADWVRARLSDSAGASDAIRTASVEESGHHDEPSSRLAMGGAISRYTAGLKALLDAEPERPLAVK